MCRYIELALKQLVTDSTLEGRDGTIALLGSEEHRDPFDQDEDAGMVCLKFVFCRDFA